MLSRLALSVKAPIIWSSEVVLSAQIASRRPIRREAIAQIDGRSTGID